MSTGAKSGVGGLRFFLRFVPELWDAESVERVYALTLDAVQEIFKPDRAFVALSESKNLAPDAQEIQRGWMHDLTLPIYAAGNLMGKVMLQFEESRSFSDYETALLELITVQAGFVIEHIQERQAASGERKKKDDLVAIAAHELRSPLTAIIGAAFLLRSGRDDQRSRAIEIIERNAQVQVTLIEELLNACQLDAGRIAVEMSTLDLVAVIEKVVDEIQPTAALSRTLLHVDLERPLMVRGDARRLWQICWNLLTNCIQFASPNGEVQIQAYNGASTVKLCVRDNGIGISQDQLPHIFERFRQGHHPPQLKSYTGLGLGLAIAKGLVTLHGGTIVAESDGPGKGACFTVTLPAAS